MSQDIRDFVTPSCELLGLGEPTHLEHSFGRLRNELFPQLVERGFRSIALETDRVEALTVNDFVQEGAGTLDSAMSVGFSHGFGDLEANRQLVAWMHEYNKGRPADERLAFHGFDASTETMSAPSPRSYLEYARDYLGLDRDIAGVAGDDEQWSRTEAVMDSAMSPGATPAADQLRSIADEILMELHTRAPELIGQTSRAEWFRAKTHVAAGLGLLQYHRQSAQQLDDNTRWTRMCAIRDVLMAQNLFDIREVEAGRGPTLVFAHNAHLQRNLSHMEMGPMQLDWYGAGAIVASVVCSRYVFIAGSLGESEALGLREPEVDTFESRLQQRITTWGLTTAVASAPAHARTDPTPEQGYFPLDQAILDGADAVLHVARTSSSPGNHA